MATQTQVNGERYTVISSDCHGGAELYQYKDYLASEFHDEFDAWAAEYEIPFSDLTEDEAARNWDSDLRLRELEDQGIVAEVIFPNTIPPFFPSSALMNQQAPASAREQEQRWAGLQAHNRWLAEFCAQAPNRRAGMAQISLRDIEASVEEIRWAKEAGLTGGVLLPGAPPGTGLPPLYAPDYEPIWAVSEELGMPLNHHTGSAVPDFGDYPEARVMLVIEGAWWAHRALWQLIFAGVLERHPDLQLAFTEQGTAWVPQQLLIMDYLADRMMTAEGSNEQDWGREIVSKFSLKPSEYWARQCHVGASFIRPGEVKMRDAVGLDRIMWGADYPHKEGTPPYTIEALRLSFAQLDDPAEVQQMLAGNAAELYGFDLDALEPIAAKVGPKVSEVAQELKEIPPEAKKCPAFAGFVRKS